MGIPASWVSCAEDAGASVGGSFEEVVVVGAGDASHSWAGTLQMEWRNGLRYSQPTIV